MTHVVTCFLRNGVDILLTHRSDEVGTYRGQWGGVSGYVERFDADGSPADPLADAYREVREETGLDETDVTLVRAGDPLPVRDHERGRDWTVHPFLFEATTRAVSPNEELAAVEWVQAPAILDRPTVPELWATYDRVRPTVDDVRTDHENGSAYVSLRALETLRDGAAVLAAQPDDRDPDRGSTAGDGGDTVDRSPPTGTGDDGQRVDEQKERPDDDDTATVRALARSLRDARPSMAAVANRINRAMADADGDGPTAVRDAAGRVARAAVAADADAAHAAVALLADIAVADRDGDGEAGPLVATLSRSGTVVDALVGAEAAVLIGESRPAREGVGVAERLADAGLDVTLTTDAALPALVARAGRDGRPAGESSEAAGEVPTREVPVPEEATVDERDATRQVDVVLVGADAVLADGSVVNKTGTFATALAAARAGVPVYVVAARDKVRPDERRTTEASPPESVYDGPAAIRVDAPTFDWTPAEVVDGVVTEDGLVATDDVAAVAAEHRRTAAWDE